MFVPKLHGDGFTDNNWKHPTYSHFCLCPELAPEAITLSALWEAIEYMRWLLTTRIGPGPKYDGSAWTSATDYAAEGQAFLQGSVLRAVANNRPQAFEMAKDLVHFMNTGWPQTDDD